ncbi:MAG: hypothetical protein EXS00_00765 [Phycisphaerales bacterium]|nr:hypothetical protein [Phycisphaerales bacterium]
MESISADDVASVVLSSSCGSTVTITVPDSNYLLKLACPGLPEGAQVGRRIRGVVHASALKISRAVAGGVFIEPCLGEPRIVQGRVLATDLRTNKLLAHVVIPMWITLPRGQSSSDFSTGELINFYVASGVSFVPST